MFNKKKIHVMKMTVICTIPRNKPKAKTKFQKHTHAYMPKPPFNLIVIQLIIMMLVYVFEQCFK